MIGKIPDILWIRPIASEVIVEEKAWEMQKMMLHLLDQPKDLGYLHVWVVGCAAGDVKQ
jgi:hypothetical protein